MENKHFSVSDAAKELQPTSFQTIRVCVTVAERAYAATHTYCAMILGLRFEKESCPC